MNLIDTNPQTSIRPSPQGRISITIGKVAVEERPDKARPCHLSGTEVIGQETASYITREWWFDKEASQTRDYCVAALLSKSGATRRATRPDPLGKARGRLFAAQKALAQDDKLVLRWLNERHHFQLLRFDLGAELRRSRDCFPRSAFGKRPDHVAASHPSG